QLARREMLMLHGGFDQLAKIFNRRFVTERCLGHSPPAGTQRSPRLQRLFLRKSANLRVIIRVSSTREQQRSLLRQVRCAKLRNVLSPVWTAEGPSPVSCAGPDHLPGLLRNQAP